MIDAEAIRYSSYSRKEKLVSLRRLFTRPLRAFFRAFGFDLVFAPHYGFPDFTQEDLDLIREVRPYTMTAPEKIFGLIESIRYIGRAQVPGEIVECGVWKGGSMMAAAKTLVKLDDTTRHLYLFDTFSGMTAPTEKDADYSGSPAEARLQNGGAVLAYAPLEQVKAVMAKTRYPAEKIHYVKGRVEHTIPSRAPDKIALLRLDSDWYESTRHELVHLFPRLSVGGILIIDDYGSWTGSKRA